MTPPVILKPRTGINVAVIFAGAVFVVIGFASALAIGSVMSLLPAALGALGLLLIAGAIAALWHRGRLTITIDPSGITIPTGSVFRPGPSVHIPGDAITTISREESLKGRLINITLHTGRKVPIQARHYCDLKTFLAHCQAQGLPTS